MQIGTEYPKSKAKFGDQQMPVVMQNVSFKPKKSSDENIKTIFFYMNVVSFKYEEIFECTACCC